MESQHEHEPSTSVSTVRGLRHLDMALLSEESAGPSNDDHRESHSPFRPSSPHSAFQSEPGSPSGDSVSSFPSVGSSFLFSSGPTSPPHPAHHSAGDEDVLGDSTSGLVIPSLTLPSPSRRPTVYGQTLGDVRLLLLGPKGSDMSAIASQLVDDNEDVVEVGIWEEARNQDRSGRGKRKGVLHVSTDWVEHRDRHGLEYVEPARNVEIVELLPYDLSSESEDVVERVLPVIHSPFREVLDILSQEYPPSGTLAHLLSSSCSPLYTALIFSASATTSSPCEKALIESLSAHIPIILLPSSHPSTLSSHSRDRSRRASTSHLSSFRPTSINALRSGLFRTPSVLSTLRSEAASRFLRWREVERAVERVQWSTDSMKNRIITNSRPGISRSQETQRDDGRWDKQAWEAQWEGSLSQEVALHLRRRRRSEPAHRSTQLSSLGREESSDTTPIDPEDTENKLFSPCASAPLDPLHIPSLVVFSFSLLGALRSRVARSIGLQSSAGPTRTRRQGKGAGTGRSFGYTLGLGLAFVGALCGFGLVAVGRI